jgi:hypothetical protein
LPLRRQERSWRKEDVGLCLWLWLFFEKVLLFFVVGLIFRCVETPRLQVRSLPLRCQGRSWRKEDVGLCLWLRFELRREGRYSAFPRRRRKGLLLLLLSPFAQFALGETNQTASATLASAVSRAQLAQRRRRPVPAAQVLSRWFFFLLLTFPSGGPDCKCDPCLCGVKDAAGAKKTSGCGCGSSKNFRPSNKKRTGK